MFLTGFGINGLHVTAVRNRDTKKGKCIPVQLQNKRRNQITDTFRKNLDYKQDYTYKIHISVGNVEQKTD